MKEKKTKVKKHICETKKRNEKIIREEKKREGE